MILSSGLLASIILNDAAVFVSLPAVLALSSRNKEDQAKVLVLILAAINIGSALTPFGNPQDVIITHYYDLSLSGYLESTIPIYLPILSVIALYSMRIKPLETNPASVKVSGNLAILGSVVIAATVLSGLTRQFSILIPLIVVAIIFSRESLSVKYLSIIPLIIGLFVILTSIDYTPHIYDSHVITYMEGYILSIIMSNIPATIALLGAPWKPLHLAVNLAGTAHPYSSLANLIGLRLAGQKGRIYIRESVVLALLIFGYGFILVLMVLG